MKNALGQTQPSPAPGVGSLRDEVEAFLYRESRLLDTDRQREWLETMVSEKVHYHVFSRQLRLRKDRAVSGPDNVEIYDEDYAMLDARVRQIESGMQWRIDPPERLRHIVSNVEVFECDEGLQVYSNCIVIRNRRLYEEDTYVYGRDDILCRCPDGNLRLLRRVIDYDQRVISGRNLLFFL
ncbi:naphthalene 1,2-dioxygenase subunit beta [Novosphingobium hassiacum]|uniref:Naphthalene 1,2-dioxygenase subunit beta n=1 Tax=Novosphingobium hassiacum TaxID=173676 RepID=A0A7W6A1A5_9SPHN|nr:aromatic-ring-hydroxylating dioxygenase subunit beta [Novosphingobium hassiacum]MBB3862888.1 naphthalene 1,2-dioxygenase subunit beta [Novosphingobium hassiacum]